MWRKQALTEGRSFIVGKKLLHQDSLHCPLTGWQFGQRLAIFRAAMVQRHSAGAFIFGSALYSRIAGIGKNGLHFSQFTIPPGSGQNTN